MTLNTPQQLGTSRSPIQTSARVALIVSKGTGGGNPPTGGGDTVLTMQYQFDALGEQGILCGTEFHDYPPFEDAPNEFDFSGWLVNIAIGAAITVACITLSVATGGLAAVAFAGAAIGAAVATTAITIQDALDGDVRGWKVALGQISFGAAVGAAVSVGVNCFPNITKAISDFAASTVTLPFSLPSLAYTTTGELALLWTPATLSGQSILDASLIGTTLISMIAKMGQDHSESIQRSQSGQGQPPKQGQAPKQDPSQTLPTRGEDVKFGSNAKSAQKLQNQMQKRGWNEQLVRDTVDNPYKTATSTNKATGNASTVYYTKEGAYVTVDDITKEVVQISDRFDPFWKPDSTIKNPYIP